MTSSIFKTTGELKEALYDKISESGLDQALAVKLGFQAYSADEVAPKLGLPIQKGGFLIPYWSFAGERTAFWRFRFLERTNVGFAALTDKKDVRYLQPKKSVNEIYIPPLIDWPSIQDDVTKSIIITEGELKAACGCAVGLPTLGLGGVWSFRSTAQHMHMLPQFSQVSWTNRTVYICYDSDAASNNMVIQAENALARELLALGAIPLVVRLPSLCPPRKTGMDDFIVSEGAEPFILYLNDAKPWKAAQELHALNEEVIYVNNPGIVLRLDNLQRIAPRAFTDHAFATKRYYEEVVTPNGTKMVERSAAVEWLKWPSRATVERITYKPGLPRITDKGELNIWKGWGCTPTEGSVNPWHELMSHIFKDEPDARKWFEQWLAFPLQNPGVKMASCSLLWGREHGSGKSTVGYSMFKIYGENSTEIQDKDLAASFNEWAENKQFVMGDEITGGDKRTSADRMKSMITQKQLRLNVKYIPSYAIPDCINYLFTSNHPDAFFLEDRDRRFFIHEVKGKPLGGEFYGNYYKWLNGSGAHALFHYLLSLDLSDFNPQAPAFMTSSKQEMIDNGKSDLGSWVGMLRDTPEVVLRLGDRVLEYSLWTTAELLALYDVRQQGKVTQNGMARELARAGFEKVYKGMPCPTPMGPQRLWLIRPFYCDGLTGTALGNLYVSERGLKWKTSSNS
jgi:hypothetical protein